jgi:hypothetical protein
MSKPKYDDKGLKWLRVRNWERYQPGKKLFKKDARLKYVLDWTDKLDNVDFQRLTYFERALFSQVCLVAGTRPLRSVLNDPTWLARETHALRTDIPHVPHALATLIAQGYLIPMKTEKFSEEEAEKGVGELIVDSAAPSVPLESGVGELSQTVREANGEIDAPKPTKLKAKAASVFGEEAPE